MPSRCVRVLTFFLLLAAVVPPPRVAHVLMHAAPKRESGEARKTLQSRGRYRIGQVARPDSLQALAVLASGNPSSRRPSPHFIRRTFLIAKVRRLDPPLPASRGLVRLRC